MTYPPYLREKARKMRVEQRLSLDEIAERLALSKSTVWYWISDIPLQRDRRTDGQIKGTLAMQAKYKALRDASYAAGARSWPILSADPRFRDFVNLYIAEGFKRTRHRVSVANSDPAVISLCHHWLLKLACRPPDYAIQYHADQDLDDLRNFWGQRLGIDGQIIRLLRKSNSNQLTGRMWRSRYGVIAVGVSDTLLRSRMEAWMDCLRASWPVDSIP